MRQQMRQRKSSTRFPARVGVTLLALGGLAMLAGADEITVQNDSLVDGGTVAICPCFAAGEEAAVWLTSPCDGNIVGIQIFWKSLLGGAQVTLEDSLIVYEAGNFPNPGAVKDSFDAPVMTDGVLNEFRYQDENQTIPISVPVSAGEEFVISLKFANSNFTNQFLPSIVSDAQGCQSGKNTVKVNGSTWTDACALGVSGDWVIRAVIECTGEPTGAACLPDGTCEEGLTEADTIALGGFWNGAGTGCGDVLCFGACFIPATEQCVQFDKATCDIVGGVWNGPGSTECPPLCQADVNGDGTLNFFDVSAFLTAFNLNDPVADFNGDKTFNFFDVSAFLQAFSAGCP
jgi:hypothetical protein